MGVDSLMDELSLLRIALRAYLEGRTPADAVAYASQQLSDVITKNFKPK